MTHTKEPSLRERMGKYVSSASNILRGRMRFYLIDSAELADWMNIAAGAVAAVNACAGLPLGKGADVKRLVETIQWYLKHGTFLQEVDAALAPFVESE